MSQLRSFSSYGQVAPVLVAAFPCVLADLDGNAAAAGWLQIFDLAAVASLQSGVTVPMKSFQVIAAGSLPSLFQTLGGVTHNNGLVVAMSSTEAVYTAVATSFDIFGEIDEFEVDVTTGKTVAGDTVTSRNALQVWSVAAGNASPKKLYKLQITERLGAARFIWIYSTDTIPSSPGFMNSTLIKLPANGTVVLNYGGSGFQPNPSSPGFNGCSIYIINADANGYATMNQTLNCAFIKAWYL